MRIGKLHRSPRNLCLRKLLFYDMAGYSREVSITVYESAFFSNENDVTAENLYL